MQNQWNKGGDLEMRKRKGQSILEYVIVLTVIVAAIALAASTLIKPAVNKAFNDSKSVIETATGKLPGATAGGGE